MDTGIKNINLIKTILISEHKTWTIVFGF